MLRKGNNSLIFAFRHWRYTKVARAAVVVDAGMYSLVVGGGSCSVGN
jgi:hypothetical protein